MGGEARQARYYSMSQGSNSDIPSQVPRAGLRDRTKGAEEDWGGLVSRGSCSMIPAYFRATNQVGSLLSHSSQLSDLSNDRHCAPSPLSLSGSNTDEV